MAPRPVPARNWSRHSVTFPSYHMKILSCDCNAQLGTECIQYCKWGVDVVTVRKMVLGVVKFATSETLVTDRHTVSVLWMNALHIRSV